MKSEMDRLKARAWKLMSEYVRRRDNGVCFTCGNTKHWKEMVAGHWKHGKLDYNEININCQCLKCNSFESGKLDKYTTRLIRIHGLEKIEWLERASNKPHKYTIVELEGIISDLKIKVKELSSQE